MFHVLLVPSKSRSVIGGILSQPATAWPELFGPFKFFHQHPYFLPCAAAGLLAFMSGTIAFLGLKEVSICPEISIVIANKALEFASCNCATKGQAAESI